MKEKNILADITLLIVAIIWGGGFIVTKGALNIMNPIYLLLLRFTLSVVAMGLIFLKRMRSTSLDDLKAGGIIGVFLFFAFLMQTLGLQYTTVSNQAFITSSNVVMVPFIVWIFSKNKPDTYEILAAIICFIGIGILSIDENFSIGLGDSLTFICAIFFGFHISSVGYFSKKHDPIILSVIQFGMAAILSLIACWIMKVEFAPITVDIAKAIGFMGLISTVLAFGMQNVAQKYTTSTSAALILSLESVFGSIFSIIFLKEKLTLKLIIGSLAIFLAIITAETKWSFLKNKTTT